MKPIIWSIKEIVEILKSRQANEFDGNIAVSGDRGNGKSTVIGKIFYRFKGFNPRKHQVYQRNAIMMLLKYQSYGNCWDDEAVNTGYKRDFQNKGQQELIKILTTYRDNFNIYASAIPNFFSLDKDLRDLYFLHLHVIERGIAVVHMPLQGRLYSQDRWDAAYNSKVEANWSKRMQKNPNFKPPYHKLTTFRGYLYFNDMTERQKKLYKEIKKELRHEANLTDFEKSGNQELSFLDKLYNSLIQGKLTSNGLMEMCLVEGKKYSAIRQSLNRILKDNGETKTVNDFIADNPNKDLHNKVDQDIDKLVPSFEETMK